MAEWKRYGVKGAERATVADGFITLKIVQDGYGFYILLNKRLRVARATTLETAKAEALAWARELLTEALNELAAQTARDSISRCTCADYHHHQNEHNATCPEVIK